MMLTLIAVELGLLCVLAAGIIFVVAAGAVCLWGLTEVLRERRQSGGGIFDIPAGGQNGR